MVKMELEMDVEAEEVGATAKVDEELEHGQSPFVSKSLVVGL